jgi:thiol-disulfide isomerase/thioredoxin
MLFVVFFFLAGCTSSPPTVLAPTKEPSPEHLVPGELPAPADKQQRAYLGLTAQEPFRLEDIQVDVLLVEVFDMYCPHCQREAPHVNRLYRRIAGDPELRGRIKLIGIGIGNTSYEVSSFAKTFDVPFPLFPDRRRHFVRELAIRQTPTFVGFARQTDGGLTQILHAPGPLGDVDDFLEALLRLAILEQPPS